MNASDHHAAHHPQPPPVLLLASASPRRRALLWQIGVPHIIAAARVDQRHGRQHFVHAPRQPRQHGQRRVPRTWLAEHFTVHDHSGIGA